MIFLYHLGILVNPFENGIIVDEIMPFRLVT